MVARFGEALFVTNTSVRSIAITATVKQKQLLLISLIQKMQICFLTFSPASPGVMKNFCIISGLSLAAMCKD